MSIAYGLLILTLLDAIRIFGGKMDDLVDLIYEAGVNTALWPAVLDRMAVIAGAQGSILLAAGTGRPQWTASECLFDHMKAFEDEGWASRNHRGDVAVSRRLDGFYTETEIMSLEEIETAPIYRDFLRPRGYGWGLGTTIVPMTGDVLIVSIERQYALGPVDPACKAELNPLRPHLARAALLAARFGLERMKAAVLSLEMIGLAAVAVRLDRKVVASNHLAANMPDTARIGASDRLALVDGIADAALERAFASFALDNPSSQTVLSFPARRTDNLPRIVHILPLIATARDIFSAADAIVILADFGERIVPDAGLLEALFDLTPAEARLAAKMSEGTSLPDIATQLGRSHETVRSQVKGIFQKTGTTGQSELVRLLSTIPASKSK